MTWGSTRTMFAICRGGHSIPFPNVFKRAFPGGNFASFDHLLWVCELCLTRDPEERASIPELPTAVQCSKKRL